jgi:hypothetical protein
MYVENVADAVGPELSGALSTTEPSIMKMTVPSDTGRSFAVTVTCNVT